MFAGQVVVPTFTELEELARRRGCGMHAPVEAEARGGRNTGQQGKEPEKGEGKKKDSVFFVV